MWPLLKIRAQRKVGELLADMERSEGGRPSKDGGPSKPVTQGDRFSLRGFEGSYVAAPREMLADMEMSGGRPEKTVTQGDRFSRFEGSYVAAPRR